MSYLKSRSYYANRNAIFINSGKNDIMVNVQKNCDTVLQNDLEKCFFESTDDETDFNQAIQNDLRYWY